MYVFFVSSLIETDVNRSMEDDVLRKRIQGIDKRGGGSLQEDGVELKLY